MPVWKWKLGWGTPRANCPISAGGRSDDGGSGQEGDWRRSRSVRYYGSEDAAQMEVGGDRPVCGDEEEDRRGRRVTVGENCHGPPPADGLTVLADCLTKMLAAEIHHRVPDSGPQAFRV
jgi:hypothetical protein